MYAFIEYIDDDELARKQPLFEILSQEDHHEITDNKERLSYEAI